MKNKKNIMGEIDRAYSERGGIQSVKKLVATTLSTLEADLIKELGGNSVYDEGETLDFTICEREELKARIDGYNAAKREAKEAIIRVFKTMI